jgi:GNAT superfamily N-acetyltransferase
MRAGEVLRFATPDDAAEIVRLRHLMFESMGIQSDDDQWLQSAEDHLRAVLAGNDLLAVVVEVGGRRLVASGVIEFQRRLPSPSNPSGSVAYISSMSTEHGWRRRGFARRMLERLVAEAYGRGVRRVELHATPASSSLYRSMGFTARDGGVEMRLDLPSHI